MRTTDRDVRRAVEAGAHSVRAVARTCGAASGCGGCTETVRELIAETRAAERPTFEGLLELAPAR